MRESSRLSRQHHEEAQGSDFYRPSPSCDRLTTLPATHLLQTNILCILPEAVTKQVLLSPGPQQQFVPLHRSNQSHKRAALILRKSLAPSCHRGEKKEQSVDTLRFLLNQFKRERAESTVAVPSYTELAKAAKEQPRLHTVKTLLHPAARVEDFVKPETFLASSLTLTTKASSRRRYPGQVHDSSLPRYIRSKQSTTKE
jgi:hypothetical protein